MQNATPLTAVKTPGTSRDQTPAPQGPSRQRWREAAIAAGCHLGISALVAGLAAALVFGLWFGTPYRSVSGGTELFLLVVGVDVVLGPLITLFVFNRAKGWRVLRRDLAVIVALQLAALAYGLYTVHLARPVALALEGARFRAVAAVDVVAEELSSAPPSLQRLSWVGPVTVRTVQPDDPNERYLAIQMGLAGFDIGTRPKYWRPWDDTARLEAKAVARPLVELLGRQPQARARIESAVAETGQPAASLSYIPLVARRTDWVVLIDSATGDVAGFAEADGF